LAGQRSVIGIVKAHGDGLRHASTLLGPMQNEAFCTATTISVIDPVAGEA
jgi:hypothetical protein